MTGLVLLHIFDAVYLVALGTWIGILLFVPFGLQTVARRIIPKAALSTFEREAWSRCYVWCAFCGAVALPSLVCGVLGVPELRGPWVGIHAGAVLIALLLTLYAGNVALPRRFDKAPNDADLASRGDSGVNILVVLNCVIVVILVALIFGHGYRKPPNSRGIVERNPEERRQYILDAIRSRGERSTEKPGQSSEAGSSALAP